MTDATIGLGTTLAYGNGATPEVFTTVAEVINISGPNMSRELPDATHLGSPNGYREFIGGLKDGGEVTLECNWIPGNATQDQSTGLLSIFDSGATKNWKVTLPTTPTVTMTFAGVVSAFEPDIPVDDKLGLSVTIKVSGKVTLA